jgi:hypothetical protein
MAFHFRLGKRPASFAGAMQNLFMAMVDAGWTVLSWSDGTTLHGPPGTGFAGFATGSDGEPNDTYGFTGGANNNYAWILLQQPTAVSGALAPPYGGRRQFIFQRNTGASNGWQWLVKYSLSGTYTTNASAPGVINTPSGSSTSDDVIVHLFDTTLGPNSTYEGQISSHAGADDGTGPTSPYGFFLANIHRLGSDVANSLIVFDPMVSGSFPSLERDPFVWYAAGQGTSTARYASDFQSDSNSGLTPRTWFRYGYAGSTYQKVGACSWLAGDNTPYLRGIPGRGSPNWGNNLYDDSFPILYVRRASLGGNAGYKGVSSMLKWTSISRNTGDSLSTTNPGVSRDRVVIGDVSIPWDGSTVPF